MRSDSTKARMLWATLSSMFVLVLAGCAGTGGQQDAGMGPDIGRSGGSYASSASFPVPAEIEDNVDFWRQVYGVWGRGQVAIHDDEHLGVVYEVIRLPGAIRNGFSREQQDQVDSRKRYYQRRLADLEGRVRAHQSLSRSDDELLDKLKQSGGVAAVYGASDRVRAQRGLRERFRRGVEISGRYDKVFREIMRRHGVPEDLAYLPHVESSFQVNARSSVGAGGVWQFMPSTGRQYMTVSRSIDERFDPILAANGAARYLSQAYGKLGSWPLAITSYNHGQGGMAKAKETHGRDIGRIVERYKGPYFGFASRNFYAEFLAAREVASHPTRYFPEGVRYEQPWSHDRIVLRSSMPAYHLARHYGTSVDRLADLNLHWRDSVLSSRSDIPAGCTVWLPAGTTQRIASQPSPMVTVAAVAKAEPARRSTPPAVRVALAKDPKPARAAAKPRSVKVAQTKPRAVQKAAVVKTASAQKAKARAKYHVVKPQETLYRVALQNGITVAQLRKLNKMHPEDTNIRPGQKLLVGI